MVVNLEQEIRCIESRVPEKLMPAILAIESLIVENPKEFALKQDSFALNVAGRLALQVEDALGSDYPVDVCIALLRLLRGVCLLHRPSRQVFNNEKHLTLLLQGIKHKNPEVQVASIETLVAVLVRQVEAIRRFEQLKGLKLVSDVFKQSRTATPVKLAILQFLFFYLIPETKFPNTNQAIPRKTTRAKQELLGRYLSNVDGLVRELEINRPFGQSEIEW